jgi:phage-related protein (TIGR01555 family)
MGRILQLWDGLRNVVSGLGGTQDKSTHSSYQLELLTRQEIDACYRSTWLGRKIHDIPAKDMTREWRAWQAGDAQIEAIEGEEARLQVQKKLRKALTWARLYGGSAMIMGLPGATETEADPETIGKGGLRYLHVVNRHQLTAQELEPDLEKGPLFMVPKLFQFQPTVAGSRQVDIHPTRMIIFKGQEIADDAPGADSASSFWGDPLLQSIADALKDNDTVRASIASLMHEAKVDVIHIPGLMNNLMNPEYDQKLIERLQIAAMIKSMNNALVLDGGDGSENSGERWETRQLNFQGLPDVMRVFLQVVCGAADVPATRLIGQAPQGMNATGDSDTRNYYDMLASDQKAMTAETSPLDTALIRSATGNRDKSIHYTWNPLWQMTPKEKADRDYTVSQTVEKYVGMGVVPADAMEESVQNLLVEHSVLPGLEEAIAASDMDADLSAEPDPIAGLDPATGQPLPAPANDPGAPGEQLPVPGRRKGPIQRAADRRRLADRLPMQDSTPRPAYVQRKLLNTDEFRRWAEGQGFTDLVDEPHVTIIASREPVDWIKLDAAGGGWSNDKDGSLTIPPGGARVVEPLGKAVVLLFNSWELAYRHGQLRKAGASWDFPEYQPHLSITYGTVPADLDLSTVEPFRGAIRLGPEIWEPFVEDAITSKSE